MVAEMAKITCNMPSVFYLNFISIYGPMVSDFRIQLPGASVLKPRVKLQEEWIRFFIFLDRIYWINGIFFAYGERPFGRRPLYPDNPVDPV